MRKLFIALVALFVICQSFITTTIKPKEINVYSTFKDTVLLGVQYYDLFNGYRPYRRVFPSTDSLRGYNNRWITNNAATAFTNLRLHYLLEGIIDFIDTALSHSGGGTGLYGIDSLSKINDTILRYRKNGVFRTLVYKGGGIDSVWGVNDSTIGYRRMGANYTFKHIGTNFFNRNLSLPANRTHSGNGFGVLFNDLAFWSMTAPFTNSGTRYTHSNTTIERTLGTAKLESALEKIGGLSGDSVRYTVITSPDSLELRSEVVESGERNFVKLTKDSITINGIIPAASADSVVVTGQYNNITRGRSLRLVPASSIGSNFLSNNGILRNGLTFQLGDNSSTPTVPWTSNRYQHSGNFSLYMYGNGTNQGNPNIIFNDLQTPSAGNPKYKNWLRFTSLDQNVAPYNTGTGNIEDGTGNINHTYSRGFNLSPANTRINPLYCAFGESMEGAFMGLQEWHKLWISKTDVQYRLESYTIDTATRDIDKYNTVSRHYLKEPSTGNIYLFAQGGSIPTLRLFNQAGTNYVGLSHNSASGGSATLSANSALAEFHLSNFNSWFFPGLSYANGYVHIPTGLHLNGSPTPSDDVNVIFGLDNSTTIGMIASSSTAFDANNGPFVAMRGNTYSANSGQRGGLFIYAGNPSSPTGIEGTILFGTGNSQERMRITAGGNVMVGTSTDGGEKFQVSGSVALDLGSDATGDIYYRNGSGTFTRLGIGTAGQVLVVNSGATAPEWKTTSLNGSTTHDFGTIGNNSSATTNITVTGAADGDFVLVTKPAASGWSNGETYFAWVSAPNTITVRQSNHSGGSAGFGSQTINVKVVKQ